MKDLKCPYCKSYRYKNDFYDTKKDRMMKSCLECRNRQALYRKHRTQLNNEKQEEPVKIEHEVPLKIEHEVPLKIEHEVPVKIEHMINTTDLQNNTDKEEDAFLQSLDFDWMMNLTECIKI